MDAPGTRTFEGRPVSGRWFEELEVGLEVRHAITRTITETDNVWFSALTMNPAPMHLDEEFAAKSEFGARIVNSLFTLGLLIGITVHELTMGTTVANLGFSTVAFPAPLFHGDTLSASSRVLAARASSSRPTQGVGESGRPRRTWNAEIAGSNPAALTITDTTTR